MSFPKVKLTTCELLGKGGSSSCCFSSYFSDVFGEQKLGSGSGSAFWVQVEFGDQHFGDVPLGFSGFRGFLR